MDKYTDEQKLAWLHSLHKRVSSATLLLTDRNDQLLIVKATYKDLWTPPDGVIDEGETPMAAAIRELEEETGIARSLYGDVAFHTSMVYVGRSLMTYKFVFEAQLLRGDSDLAECIRLPADEIEAWEMVSRQEVIANPERFAFTIRAWANSQRGYIEHELQLGE